MLDELISNKDAVNTIFKMITITPAIPNTFQTTPQNIQLNKFYFDKLTQQFILLLNTKFHWSKANYKLPVHAFIEIFYDWIIYGDPFLHHQDLNQDLKNIILQYETQVKEYQGYIRSLFANKLTQYWAISRFIYWLAVYSNVWAIYNAEQHKAVLDSIQYVLIRKQQGKSYSTEALESYKKELEFVEQLKKQPSPINKQRFINDIKTMYHLWLSDVRHFTEVIQTINSQFDFGVKHMIKIFKLLAKTYDELHEEYFGLFQLSKLLKTNCIPNNFYLNPQDVYADTFIIILSEYITGQDQILPAQIAEIMYWLWFLFRSTNHPTLKEKNIIFLRYSFRRERESILINSKTAQLVNLNNYLSSLPPEHNILFISPTGRYSDFYPYEDKTITKPKSSTLQNFFTTAKEALCSKP